MSFADKVKRFTNDAVEKGKGLAEQGKLALENQKQQEAVKQAKLRIGAYVAENDLLADDAFVMEQLAAIAAANEAVEQNSARIAALRTAAEAENASPDDLGGARSARFCSHCGIPLGADARFCPGCGEKLG